MTETVLLLLVMTETAVPVPRHWRASRPLLTAWPLPLVHRSTPASTRDWMLPLEPQIPCQRVQRPLWGCALEVTRPRPCALPPATPQASTPATATMHSSRMHRVAIQRHRHLRAILDHRRVSAER